MKSANKDVHRIAVIQPALNAKGHPPNPSRRDAIRVRGTGAHTAVPNDGISLGTNDLTQIAPGMSRDDSGSFLPGYAEIEIVKKKSWRTATVRHA